MRQTVRDQSPTIPKNSAHGWRRTKLVFSALLNIYQIFPSFKKQGIWEQKLAEAMY